MKILVCGGAGYIGSHVVRALVDQHEQVVVLDNLSTGHAGAVPKGVALEMGDIRDKAFLKQVFKKQSFDCVMHFCANSQVGESMEKPLMYYHNNVCGTVCLLETMIEYEVKNFVFSSSAAVYGEPEQVPIEETAQKQPTNTYGETKLAVEKMLKWTGEAHGLKYMVFRYFNAAGAHPSGNIGEDHRCETHLLPLILQTALGQREQMAIFGEDYPTADGTCVRDYIHVMDIASAHILGMKKLLQEGHSEVFNLGNGNGFSVREVIERAQAITGIAFKVVRATRRSGDPAVLIAASQKAQSQLGWRPEYSDLDTIIETAWRWHSGHPYGFKE